MIEILLTNPYAVKQFQDLLVSVLKIWFRGFPVWLKEDPPNYALLRGVAGLMSDTTLFSKACPVKIESASILAYTI